MTQLRPGGRSLRARKGCCESLLPSPQAPVWGPQPWEHTLEILPQLPEARQDQQLARAALHRSVLQLPGGVVRNEDGIEPRRKRGVDVAVRTVAHHPGVFLHDAVLVHQPFVSVYVFLAVALNCYERA